MKRPEPAQLSDWSAGLRVWLNRGGQAVLGPGRLELLESIAREHSISEAARRMGMSYRRAWLLVQSINERAGLPVVEAATGGIHGGGARLTPYGQQLLAVFRELQERLGTAARGALPGLLAHVEPSAAVHVAAAISLDEVLGRLLSDFALRHPTVPVRVIFGASDELADHIVNGAAADLFLSADEKQIARLAAAGLVEPSVQVPLASNRLVVLGSQHLHAHVRRSADLVRPETARIACAKPGSPLGNYTFGYLQGTGLLDRLRPRLLMVDNARMVVPTLHAGQADLGFVYGSEAAAAVGCRTLFAVPRSAAGIRIGAALLRGGRQKERGRLLLDFLASSAARRRFRECGFLPLRAR